MLRKCSKLTAELLFAQHSPRKRFLISFYRRRKKEEGRMKKEEGRRKKEEGKVLHCLSFKLLICPHPLLRLL
ncbi:MAG: hypothetical protein F6K39_22440 [Okeania sp. SIO3B3]|nr:hypothetical protein [Okeania sp. SIO3B3]